MSLTADEQLMLLAARAAPDADARHRIRELVAAPLDWERFVEIAVRHGVAPLADRGLGLALGSDRLEVVPARANAELERLAATSAVRNERLLAALSAILDALRSRGIRPLGLKDLGLAVEVFPEPGLRPLGDLDLLIRRDEYDEVTRAMGELGYRPRMARGASFTLTHGWGHHLRRERDNVWVDVQWNVLQREWGTPGVDRRSFDPDVLRDGAYGVMLPRSGSCELLVGPPEATLFHLCSHLEGHEYAELILFCDIAELLRQRAAELDWDRLVGLAERFEAKATVSYVLDLTRRMLAAPVPAEAMTALAGDTFRGAVFPAVFGGLGALHYSLDDIQAKIGPPPSLMGRLESAVRDHAANARALYDEVDAVLGDFTAAGGELMVLASDGSGRRFPDPRLQAFGTVELVVLQDDVDRLDAICAARGYAPGPDGSSARVIAREGGELEVRMRAARADILFASPAQASTNREIARRSLAVRLRGRRVAAEGEIAAIRVTGVDRAELVAWLLARLGARTHDALFALPPLLDALSALLDRPGAQAVIARASGVGAGAAVERGIAIAAGFAVDDPLIAELSAAFPGAAAASALEWAREGPEAEQARQDLRDAYLGVLCLLQARRGERRPLLGAMARGRNGASSQLATIAAALSRALRGQAGPAPRPPEVYWLEG